MSATIALGWLGTALVLVAYAQPSARRLRIVSLVASVVLIAFNAVLGIWSNVALEIALVVVNLVQLVRFPKPAAEVRAEGQRRSPWRIKRSRERHPQARVQQPEREAVSA